MIRRGFMMLALGASLSAHAFSPYYSQGKPLRWDLNYTGYSPTLFNASTKAIRYYIGSDTATSANRTAELNAIRAAFAQWQSIPGTVLKFEEAGLATTGVDINLSDGRNLIFWAKSNSVNNGLDDITNLAGWTLVSIGPGNRIEEADTALNAAMFSWFTDFNNTAAGAQFVEAIAAHEIGHLIGLDHTPLGGATVIDSGPGISANAGLSPDEIGAARFLYPAAATLAQLGTISGTVRMNGAGIRGAMVTAEDASGNAISATASDTAGNYSLPALPPGAYNIHVSPLDPDSAETYLSLFRGEDVAPDFTSTVTAFKATENTAATVTAGAGTTVNFAVASGEPSIRVQQISKPTPFASAPSPVRYAVSMKPGETMYVGVASSALPADSVLSISGDGITIGPMIYEPNRFFGSLNVLHALVTVASNATPGLRTFVVRRGSEVAYANGYLEIPPGFPDFNFDGLDDRFQRQFFPLFTAPEAAPNSDPDADHFSNAFEALTGTNPTDPRSFSFLIERVDLARSSARVTWKSDVGKQYQLYGKDDVAGAIWQAIGAPITATSASTSVVDAATAGGPKFYKLKLLP